MGLSPSTLSSVYPFFTYIRTQTSHALSHMIPPKRSHSMRKRSWYVTPMNSSIGDTGDYTGYANWVDKKGKVLCGHLFNGHAERDKLGLLCGEGEECPISLEPIADARLQFGENICVEASNHELTGVELLCGHRFSAVFLLWHWTRSPMICPMCREKYSLGCGNVENTPPCTVENFPRKHWRKLRAILREQKMEEDTEELRLIESYHTESVVDETIETVLGPSQQFFLMLSLNNIDGRSIIQYMPLYRTNNNLEAISDDSFRFSVQRSALRRFTSAVSNINITTSGIHATTDEERVLNASVVLRVGNEYDEQSYLFRVAQMADVRLPAFRLHDRTVRTVPTIQSTEDILISEAADLLLQLQAPPTGDTALGLSGAVHDAVPNVTTTDTLGSTLATRISAYRYTTVDTHCMEMNGVLTMEMCEEVDNTGIDSLHAITLNLQACSLMSEVARCFSSV
jgi:hypothetical protein